MYERNLFIDKIKGVAIILVVWGHCIQYCAGYDFFGNKLFELIYSFHMPLFMAVSGYLFYHSINRRPFKKLITSRFRQLLIPLCIWTLIIIILFPPDNPHSPLEWVKYYSLTLPVTFWFLWSLLLCSLITICINKLLKDSLIAYFIIFIFIILLPNFYGLYFTKYMIPYFFAGYLVHKFNLKSNLTLSIISFLVFSVLVYYWKREYYIYTTLMITAKHLDNFRSIYDDCYRYLAGFVGILVFLAVIRKLPDLKIFEILGRYTLGIYVISGAVLPYLNLLRLHYDPVLYNFIYTPVVAMVIITVCVGLSILISKSKVLNQYLLGGR